jgi:hypothetical protein
MSTVDNIGLMILTAAALAYLYDSGAPEAETVVGVPNQEREVDLSRWRHDGTQPLYWTKGNGASFIDETASALEPLLV